MSEDTRTPFRKFMESRYLKPKTALCVGLSVAIVGAPLYGSDEFSKGVNDLSKRVAQLFATGTSASSADIVVMDPMGGPGYRVFPPEQPRPSYGSRNSTNVTVIYETSSSQAFYG